jgi:HK97 family phage portal protein
MNLFDKIVGKYIEKKYTKYTKVHLHEGESFEFNETDRKRIAKEGFQKNPFVKAGVITKANAQQQVPIILIRKRKDGKYDNVYDHPAIKLINKPNPLMGKSAFFNHLYCDFAQYGEAIIHKVSPDRGENKGIPRYLYPIRPDLVTIKTGTATNPFQEIIVRNTTEVRIAFNEIVFIKKYNPTDYFRGESDVFSAGHLIDLNNNQINWNNNLLKNKGVPSYYLTTEGFITKDQADSISESVHKKINGHENAGKPFVTYGGLRIEKLGFNAQDIEWLKGLEMSGELILMSMGVPSVLLRSGGTNANIYKSAERWFLINTVLPEVQQLLDRINTDILHSFPNSDDLEFIIDKDQILALNEDIEMRHRTVRADFLSGLVSQTEGRDELDYEPAKSTEGFVSPLNVSTAGSDINPQANV